MTKKDFKVVANAVKTVYEKLGESNALDMVIQELIDEFSIVNERFNPSKFITAIKGRDDEE